MAEDQRKIYEEALKAAREKLRMLDAQIEEEVNRAKQKVAALKLEKDSTYQVYESLCNFLGIENELRKVDTQK